MGTRERKREKIVERGREKERKKGGERTRARLSLPRTRVRRHGGPRERKSKRNGGRKERRRDQEHRPRNKKAVCQACLPALFACPLACLPASQRTNQPASHPKFPSRYVYARVCVRGQSVRRCQAWFHR